ncbi:MAG: hypothetical protein K0Q54_4628, partial [Methylobacterium brachiatum]|nr:hypothetical protein [Methylobacterium brachiatum]
PQIGSMSMILATERADFISISSAV